jgi:acetyl esterase/lipase
MEGYWSVTVRLTFCMILLVCVAGFGLTACSPFKTLNAFVPDNANRVVAGIAYGTNARQKLDIYKPAGVTDPPVVVFFYGGSWSSGTRAEYKFVGDALSSRGILTVIADYRVYPQVSYPGFVEDSAQAVAWTLHHVNEYGGDAKRVFVAGHSAGAYNAAMVALDPRWLARFGASPTMLRGFIGLAGPYNFLPIEDEGVKPVFHYPDTTMDTQPISHVTNAAPPTLLLTAADDKVVDPNINSGKLAQALRAAQVPVQTISYKGISHGMLVGVFARPLTWLRPVLDDVSKFVLQTKSR